MKIQLVSSSMRSLLRSSTLLAASFVFVASSGVAGPTDVLARPKLHQRYPYIGVQSEMPEHERLQISRVLYEVDDALARVKADPAKNSGGIYILDPSRHHFRGSESGVLFEGMYKLEMAPEFIRAMQGTAQDPKVRESIGTAAKYFSTSVIWFMDLYRIAPDWENNDRQRTDVNFLLRHGDARKESSYEFSMEGRALGILLDFNKALLEVGAVSSAVTLADYWGAVGDTKNFKFSPLAQITVANMRKAILEHSLKHGLDLQGIRAGVAALKSLDVPLRAVQGWQFQPGADTDAAAENGRAIWHGTSVVRLIALRLEIIAAIESAKGQIDSATSTMSVRDRVEAKRVLSREYSISDGERRLVEHEKLDLALKSLSAGICREMFIPTFGN